jgi:chromosome partitioning protein
MIIAISGTQSGTGKTSLAQAISAYLKVELNKDVILIDCEPTQNALSWSEKRENSGLKAIKTIPLGKDVTTQLEDLSLRYEMIILDCSSKLLGSLTEIFTQADHVLLPLRPQWQDLNSLPQIDLMLQQFGLSPRKASVALNQCPANPELLKKVRAAKSLCRNHKFGVLSSVINFDKVYQTFNEQGSTIFDTDAKSHCAWEIRNIFNELLAKSMGIEFAQSVSSPSRKLVNDKLENG